LDLVASAARVSSEHPSLVPQSPSAPPQLSSTASNAGRIAARIAGTDAACSPKNPTPSALAYAFSSGTSKRS
jgi:hypothetical protein